MIKKPKKLRWGKKGRKNVRFSLSNLSFVSESQLSRKLKKEISEKID